MHLSRHANGDVITLVEDDDEQTPANIGNGHAAPSFGNGHIGNGHVANGNGYGNDNFEDLDDAKSNASSDISLGSISDDEPVDLAYAPAPEPLPEPYQMPAEFSACVLSRDLLFRIDSIHFHIECTIHESFTMQFLRFDGKISNSNFGVNDNVVCKLFHDQ